MSKKQLVIAIALLSELFLTTGCRSGKIQIEYIFPDGFRGAAVIRENQAAGIPSCETPWLPRTQICILKFPATGILDVQGDSPGKLWHWASARYVNGTAIPVPYTNPGVGVSKETIALWTFGSVQNGEDWVFVGTDDEFTKFRDEKFRTRQ